jgi:hypothetical protein
MNVPPDASDAVEAAEQAPAATKGWRFRITKSSGLFLLSVVSTTALLLSNFEKIESFVRARMPGALVGQFPFTMQISSTHADGKGVQEKPFYREEHIQRGTTLIRAIRNQDFGLPALNFRIVNNSPETTIVREVIFKVANSQPDNRPILTWSKQLNLADGDNELVLENDGWGPALDAKIENLTGTLIPKSGEKKTSDPFELVLGKISTKSRDVPLTSLIKDQLGLENLADFNRAKLSGTLSYFYIDSSGEKKPVTTPFALGIVNRRMLDIPAEGPPGANVFQTVQLLQTHAQNYSVVCPVSESLEPKKSYQFVVSLCSRQSAIHDFEVIVALANGARIKLGHYRLEFYLPRSHADFVSEITTKPNPPRFTSIDGLTEDIPGVGTNEETADDGEDESDTVADTDANDEIPSPALGPDLEEVPGAEVSNSKEPAAPSNVQAELKPVKASYPYGIPVAGRSDVVESPFMSGKHVDVTGFAHNAIVQDPYVKQLFLVP